VRAQIVWVKTRPVVSRGHYHWQHEPVFYAAQDDADELEHGLINYAVREGETGHWTGGRKQSTVWFIEHLKSDTGHSTQKPVECMRRPIENNSRAGDAVYDPFIGSGTTIIAAEMTERTCYALDISPAYCDVAVERWQNFTGRKAERIQARADAA
jgi:site-specific DNA-methyltransferase (adenine-specific)